MHCYLELQPLDRHCRLGSEHGRLDPHDRDHRCTASATRTKAAADAARKHAHRAGMVPWVDRVVAVRCRTVHAR